MKQFFKKYLGWLLESNRPKHFIVGFFIAGVVGIIPVIVAAFAAEYKDWAWNGSKGRYPIFGWKTSNGFDWLDLFATVLGGAIISGISVIFTPGFSFFHGII